MSTELFPADAPATDPLEARVIAAYVNAGRTLDDLPYTSEFQTIAREVREAGIGLSDRDLFHRLHNIRKAGRLPAIGSRRSTPPRISEEEEQTLTQLVVAAVGSTGKRDQLPFTPAFDTLAQRFNASIGRVLTPHDVWRLIAKLSK